MDLHSENTAWRGGESDRRKFNLVSEATKVYGDYIRKDPLGLIQDDGNMDLYLERLGRVKIQSFVKAYGSKATAFGEPGWYYNMLLGRSSISRPDRATQARSVRVARDLYLQVTLNPADQPEVSMRGMFFVPEKASRLAQTYVAGSVS